MPELVQLHQKLEAEGVVVVGINFDDEVETVHAAIDEHGLSWVQVHAATAARGRDDLWEAISGISGLPRLLLVDREGVLRDDFYPNDLLDHVQAHLEEESDPP